MSPWTSSSSDRAEGLISGNGERLHQFRKCKECDQWVPLDAEHHHTFRCRDCSYEWSD